MSAEVRSVHSPTESGGGQGGGASEVLSSLLQCSLFPHTRPDRRADPVAIQAAMGVFFVPADWHCKPTIPHRRSTSSGDLNRL